MRALFPLAAVFTLILTGCGPKHPPAEAPVQPQGHLLQGQQDALDKAKALDGQLQQIEQQRQEEIEAAAGG